MADVMCPPSWDRATEVFPVLSDLHYRQIRLRNPVTILPHSRRAFYIHSSLPDDLGIQYQSFLEDDIIFQDERIAVYPGLGHTV